MDKNKVLDFFDYLKNDKESAEKFKTITEKLSTVKNEESAKKLLEEELIPFAKSKGYNITYEDFLKFTKSQDSELSDNILEMASGGRGGLFSSIGQSLLIFGTGAGIFAGATFSATGGFGGGKSKSVENRPAAVQTVDQNRKTVISNSSNRDDTKKELKDVNKESENNKEMVTKAKNETYTPYNRKRFNRMSNNAGARLYKKTNRTSDAIKKIDNPKSDTNEEIKKENLNIDKKDKEEKKEKNEKIKKEVSNIVEKNNKKDKNNNNNVKTGDKDKNENNNDNINKEKIDDKNISNDNNNVKISNLDNKNEEKKVNENGNIINVNNKEIKKEENENIIKSTDEIKNNIENEKNNENENNAENKKENLNIDEKDKERTEESNKEIKEEKVDTDKKNDVKNYDVNNDNAKGKKENKTSDANNNDNNTVNEKSNEKKEEQKELRKLVTEGKYTEENLKGIVAKLKENAGKNDIENVYLIVNEAYNTTGKSRGKKFTSGQFAQILNGAKDELVKLLSDENVKKSNSYNNFKELFNKEGGVVSSGGVKAYLGEEKVVELDDVLNYSDDTEETKNAKLERDKRLAKSGNFEAIKNRLNNAFNSKEEDENVMEMVKAATDNIGSMSGYSTANVAKIIEDSELKEYLEKSYNKDEELYKDFRKYFNETLKGKLGKEKLAEDLDAKLNPNLSEDIKKLSDKNELRAKGKINDISKLLGDRIKEAKDDARKLDNVLKIIDTVYNDTGGKMAADKTFGVGEFTDLIKDNCDGLVELLNNNKDTDFYKNLKTRLKEAIDGNWINDQGTKDKLKEVLQ